MGAGKDVTTPKGLNLGMTRLETRVANHDATSQMETRSAATIQIPVQAPNHCPISQLKIRTRNPGATTRAATLAANHPATLEPINYETA